jgi:hypothetical protein
MMNNDSACTWRSRVEPKTSDETTNCQREGTTFDLHQFALYQISLETILYQYYEKPSGFWKIVMKKVDLTLKTVSDYKHVHLQSDCREFFIELCSPSTQGRSLIFEQFPTKSFLLLPPQNAIVIPYPKLLHPVLVLPNLTTYSKLPLVSSDDYYSLC